MFEQDEQHFIIAAERLPPGTVTLRDPDFWSLEERHAWSMHIRGAESGDIPPERRFQFKQPRPGVFDLQLRSARSEDARVHFPPDSIAYRIRLNRMRRGQGGSLREDGLPPVFDGVAYQAISQECIENAEESMKDSVALGLLKIIKYYDVLGPHQVSSDTRTHGASLMVHKGRGISLEGELRRLSSH